MTDSLTRAAALVALLLTSTAAPVTGQSDAPAPSLATSVDLDHIGGRETLRVGDFSSIELIGKPGAPAATLAIAGKRWPLDDIVGLRFRPPRPDGTARPAPEHSWWLLLRTGDLLLGTIVKSPETAAGDDSDGGGDDEEETVRFAVQGWTSALAVPYSAMHALIPNAAVVGVPGRPEDAGVALRRVVRQVVATQSEDDIVILRETSGTTSRLSGIVDRISPTQIFIDSERLGTIEVGYDKTLALVIAKLDDDPVAAPPANASRQAHLTLRSGGTLAGALRTIADGTVEIEHALLGRRRLAVASLSGIELLGGRLTYLSDLKPLRVEEHPGLFFDTGDRFAFKRDTNVLGGPLKMRGRTWRKGLGVHAHSLLVYALPAGAERFEATVGLDDIARPRAGRAPAGDVAAVVFRVKIDGQLLYEKPLSWRDDPADVQVPVRAGSELSLEVDYGGVPGSMISTLDRADWAGARIIKSARSAEPGDSAARRP